VAYTVSYRFGLATDFAFGHVVYLLDKGLLRLIYCSIEKLGRKRRVNHRIRFSLFAMINARDLGRMVLVTPLSGKEVNTKLGKLVLSEEAIATIAGVAATECYGVVGMAGRKMSDGIAELLGRENLSKGVSVSVDAQEVYIDLFIIVGYGVRISEVGRMVVNKVRYTVENATGLTVRKVTVNVQGIRFQENSGS
jgi:uncharacterized alkaline shock family protein YloU